MVSSVLSAGCAALLLVGKVGSHMVMTDPYPYNLAVSPCLQVEPLQVNNNPYPCQNKLTPEWITTVEAGKVTLDPSANGWNTSAKFKTIYSIIGGCPGQFSLGREINLPIETHDAQQRNDTKRRPNDSDLDCTRQFLIPIPSWNCAPVNSNNGSGDQNAIDELPDIFVANYSNDPSVQNCVTADRQIVKYPNPGKYGHVLESPIDPADSQKQTNYCSLIQPASNTPPFETNTQTIQCCYFASGLA
ncbi:hypothetical protein B0H63DRAFT_491338 [Podospora didyma]|uniref:Secreted protein n=1 Tax=Podospora didyma TaxID=330526 RepID=A0AAE0U710_9PEZI|nr:hypothetical protein B0H63DRAFT_491338 [Podospora didyma]